MAKPKILIQLDRDAHASVFDAVVAVDAGVDQLLQYGDIERFSAFANWCTGRSSRAGRRTCATRPSSSAVRTSRPAKRCCGRCPQFLRAPAGVGPVGRQRREHDRRSPPFWWPAGTSTWPESTATVLAGTGPVGQRAARLLARAAARCAGV